MVDKVSAISGPGARYLRVATTLGEEDRRAAARGNRADREVTDEYQSVPIRAPLGEHAKASTHCDALLLRAIEPHRVDVAFKAVLGVTLAHECDPRLAGWLRGIGQRNGRVDGTAAHGHAF